MAVTRRWRLRTSALCFVVAAGLFQIETHSFKKYLAVELPESRKYEATAFLNLWGPYELPILWSGGVRSDFTDEEFKAFTRRTAMLALDNPALT